jgi:hypothetical protein
MKVDDKVVGKLAQLSTMKLRTRGVDIALAALGRHVTVAVVNLKFNLPSSLKMHLSALTGR